MSPRRAVAVLCLLSALLGCDLLRPMVPRWSERSEPIVPRVEVADHRRAERLSFVVFGDSGTGKPEQREVGARIAAECAAVGGCDFALMAGDNIYPAGVPAGMDTRATARRERLFERKFERAYAALGRTDFWAVPGNHDWYREGSVDAEVRYTDSSPRWRMLAHDYAIPRLPAWLHVYALDTTRLEQGEESGQLARAEQALCGKPGWRLLLGHHPVYSSGRHANARGELPRTRRLLEPLIEKCGVQLYFAGHDHHQEHLSAPAFEQVIQGAAAKLRDVRRIEDRTPGVKSLGAARRLGFALVEATRSRIELRFIGRDATGGYGVFHCRTFELEAFEEQSARSASCPL